MLENQSKKILLISNDPADASFLSEIAVTQQADLELALNTSELCSKIALARSDRSLAAIFVDVSNSTLLRKFEHDLQSKMGNSLAAELSQMIHYRSGTPLSVHREVLQSPYFSFYSERKAFDFAASAQFYQNSFYSSSDFTMSNALSFDQTSRAHSFEKLKKEFLLHQFSAEWILKFKNIFDEVLEQVFPARFELFVDCSDRGFKIVIHSNTPLNHEQFRIEKVLEFGVSASISRNKLVLFAPVFKTVSSAHEAFRFYKVEK